MSVNAVQKMVAIMPQVDLVLGDKTVNIARDRGIFVGYIFLLLL